MTSCWLYRQINRLGIRNYRAKIMVVAFIGTHIPLIALATYFAWQSMAGWAEFAATLAVTLAATLLGTMVTLCVLNELLKPVIMTSRALRGYRTDRAIPALPTTFTDEVGTLMADAQQTVDHLERSLVTLERFDATTGLPNRAGFLEAVARRAENEASFAVVAVRLKNFAQLAETFDQGRAETIMRDLAGRLRSTLAGEPHLARISESDFALMMPVTDTGAHAWDAVAFSLRGILREVSGDIRMDEVTIKPLLLAGHAACGDGEQAPERSLDDAVNAAAQGTESAPVVFHSVETRERARERFVLEQDLRAAIRNEEFELHYQPVVDIEAGRTTGAEALIRWNSPERGLVSPGVFIPVAEASGLIDTIGLWVLRQACRQLAEWDDDTRVAVNLSARQFLDPDLKWHVAEAVQSAGIRADRLEIELTETTAMVDHDHTRRAFATLRDMGVGIAIDDFGTGYASMSYLRKLPFRKLKIDREFVTDVHASRGSQAICTAMIELGTGLGLQVLAEGTETAEEVGFLAGNGCNLFQGYYFSRPVPAGEFPAVAANLGESTQGMLRRAG